MLQPLLAGMDYRHLIIILQNGAQIIGLHSAVVDNQYFLDAHCLFAPPRFDLSLANGPPLGQEPDEYR